MPISGKEMLKRYLKDGWVILSRKGSHVKVGKNGDRESIPMHKELHTGMEHRLLKHLQKGGN